MTDQNDQPDFSTASAERPKRRLSVRTGMIAAALLAAGVGGGATVARMGGPRIEMAPASPVAIKSLSNDESGGERVVTVRGKVAEVFGQAFVLADGSGRALVEAGHRGWGGDGARVAVGQTVSVQGRFHDGTLHASFLVGADGKVTALRPMGPPRGFRRGGSDGPGARGLDGGPDRGPDRGPGLGPQDDGAPPPLPAAPSSAPGNGVN